jgi:ASC-1-like (ASCH) protein
MKIWRLRFASLKSPDDIFNLIIDGTKTIETRSRNPDNGKRDYSNVSVGDKLLFCSVASGREIKKEVTFVHPYKSVEEMLDNENFEKILPGVGSKENYLNVIADAKKKWGKKYAYELENYGIIAMGFK